MVPYLLMASLWLPAILCARLDPEAVQRLNNKHDLPPRFPTTFQVDQARLNVLTLNVGL